MKDASAIKARELTVRYPDGRVALSEVSFDIREGESVAVLGANGAGKSTLLLSLVGVLRGTGEIEVGGVTVSADSLARVRRKAQLVFQDPNDQLFMPILKDDIAFGPLNFGVERDKVPEIVAKSLADVGLQGFEERNPHQMSLGERRRAAIATALACEPDILLLDEPGAGLDPRGKKELVELLKSLQATKLIATHDLDFAKSVCDTVLLLSAGRVVKTGPAAELLDDESTLQRCGLR